MPDGPQPTTNSTPSRADGFASRRTNAAPSRAPRQLETPIAQPMPIWIAWLCGLAVAAALTAFAVWWRRGAYRTWQSLSRHWGGEFTAKNGFSPAAVSGSIRERDLLMTASLSYEDDAPYYHTCARMPVKNPARFVLGLRRKSLLEEAQTRRDAPTTELEDPAFERQFFIICNDPKNLPAILTPEIRRELSRYNDVEIYCRLNQIEWRRAGEQRDREIILRLSNVLADIADSIDALPRSSRTLTQSLADEALIEKGV